jgi:hypothetical protein
MVNAFAIRRSTLQTISGMTDFATRLGIERVYRVSRARPSTDGGGRWPCDDSNLGLHEGPVPRFRALTPTVAWPVAGADPKDRSFLAAYRDSLSLWVLGV